MMQPLSVSAEIARHRAEERAADRASAEADRLCAKLVSVYACNFVIAENFPYRTWGALPSGWANGVEHAVTLRACPPPRDLRGAVAVSLMTLRWLGEGR